MHFEIDERQPIYRQITEALIRQIARGHWPPGEKLPSIREVAEAGTGQPKHGGQSLSGAGKNRLG